MLLFSSLFLAKEEDKSNVLIMDIFVSFSFHSLITSNQNS